MGRRERGWAGLLVGPCHLCPGRAYSVQISGALGTHCYPVNATSLLPAALACTQVVASLFASDRAGRSTAAYSNTLVLQQVWRTSGEDTSKPCAFGLRPSDFSNSLCVCVPLPSFPARASSGGHPR